jgi:2-polyprenyl-6-hydroxyphenyl methylase/3-demethylubiquinone-9 3-methyltransferase
MGRYIDEILQPGEKVLYSTNAHWIFYLPAIAAWIVALGAVRAVAHDHPRARPAVPVGGGRGGDRALYWTVKAWFHRWTTETDVTNLRVVHKTGFIKRRTFEMSLDKVESVDVNQSILGRILNYGDVTIRASARARRPSTIASPLDVPQLTSPRDRSGASSMAMQQILLQFFRRAAGSTVDPAEVAKFSKLSDEWWDPNGKMAPLHKINPLRLTYIRDAACRKFERNVKSLNCLSGLRILDIGCGAGIVVRAVHPARRAGDRRRSLRQQHRGRGCMPTRGICRSTIAAPRSRRWTCASASTSCWRWKWSSTSPTSACSSALRRDAEARRADGGLDLNRNWKSFALAIVGAEYVLRWLPRGTHQWDKFVTPDELAHHLERQQARHHRADRRGLQPVRRPLEPLVRHGRELHGGGGGNVRLDSWSAAVSYSAGPSFPCRGRVRGAWAARDLARPRACTTVNARYFPRNEL